MSYLLSVVIPTKNRYKYLRDCILSLKNIAEERLEVVVHDNTEDNSEIAPYIEEMRWSGLKYIHHKEPVSVSENSTYAILHSSGEYVCFIGDDDSICPKMLDAAEFMKKKEIDSCIFNIPRYNWPDMVFSRHQQPPLWFRPFKGGYHYVDLENQLHLLMKNAANSLFQFPKVYHGVVSRKALDQIYEKTGTFFPGPSPDMANAVALSLVVQKHVYIDMPLMISGFSYKSTGGQGSRHKHAGKVEDIPWLPKDTVQKWNADVPLFWTAETIYAESALKALQAMHADLARLPKFNFSFLYSDMISHHPNIFSLISPHVFKAKRIFPVAFYLILITLRRAKNYVFNLLRYRIKSDLITSVPKVSSLMQAQKIMDEYANEYSCEIPAVSKPNRDT